MFNRETECPHNETHISYSMCQTYSAVFYEIADHDNSWTLQLPNHAPHVVHCVLVWTYNQLKWSPRT